MAKSAKKKKPAKKSVKLAAKPKAAKKPVKAGKKKSVKAAKAKKGTAKKVIKKAAQKAGKANTQKPTVKSTMMVDLRKLISPLDDRVIVEVQTGERVTAGGLIIPDTAEITGNVKGKVLAVGRGHQNKKGKVSTMDVQVGDTVLMNEYSGDSIEIHGKKLKIVRESELLGILEK